MIYTLNSTDVRALFDNALQFVVKAPQNYEYWWLKLYAEAPQHILIETCLVCFIIWLVLIRKTIDPGKSSNIKKFTEKEIQHLVDTWTPDPIVPPINDKLVAISQNVKVGFILFINI